MKKILFSLVTACLVAAALSAAAADETVTMSVNLGSIHGTILTPNVTIEDVRVIYTSDGDTLIELRKIAEALNYDVRWNGETRTIDLVNGFGETEWTVDVEKDSFTNVTDILNLIDAGTESIPVRCEVVDGITYVPLMFIKDNLSNYNEPTLYGIPIEEEFSLIGGRLRVKMPKGTKYADNYGNSIMAAEESDKRFTHLSFSSSYRAVDVYAQNIIALSTGDLRADAENLGLQAAEGAAEFSVNGLDLLDLEITKAEKEDTSIQRALIVRTPDERLYYISIGLNKSALAHPGYAKLTEDIVLSLAPGEPLKNNDNFMGISLDVPENYETIVEYGADFATADIYKLIPCSNKHYCYVGIYEGFYPSTNIAALEKNMMYIIRGKFLGQEIKWYIDGDGCMDALVQNGYECYHLYSGPLTEDERREFIDLIGGLTISE